MEICKTLTGLVFCLMIGLASSRPQYNYQRSSAVQTAALPNLSFNTGSASSLPSSYSPGLVQNSNTRLLSEPSNINSFSGQLQIVPSQPVSQMYLPPVQQSFPPSQQYLPPLSTGQQIFKDVSQLPLQTQNSFSAIPVAPAFNAQSLGLTGHPSNLNQQLAVPQQRTVITKDIYVHTAPQEPDDDIDFRKQLASVPIRRNYRIIFIKAPTQNLRVAAEALKRAQAVNEERTVIYVLSKKSDVADLQKQLVTVQNPQTVSRKPEVYFIKYKTNEEAQRAQQEIQAQYDALGGSTNISDEGIAPLTSVIGALGNDHLSSSGSGQSGSILAPTRQYLPPVKV